MTPLARDPRHTWNRSERRGEDPVDAATRPARCPMTSPAPMAGPPRLTPPDPPTTCPHCGKPTSEGPPSRDPIPALRDIAAEARADARALDRDLNPSEAAFIAALDAAADAYPTDADSPVVAALARFALALVDESESAGGAR